MRWFLLLPFILAAAANAQQAAPTAEVTKSVPLDEVIEGEILWKFMPGREAPGAKGGLTLVKHEPEEGRNAMRFEGDFTGGGAYVMAQRVLDDLVGSDVASVRLRVKSDKADTITVRLVDATGQAHQRKGVKLVADGQYHDLVLKPSEIAGGERWGGAKDGKWHGPPKSLTFILSKPKEGEPKVAIHLAEITAEVVSAGRSGKPAFLADFEEAALGSGWTTEGAVTLDAKEPFQGAKSLAITLDPANIRQKTSATSPPFPVAPGPWEVKLATKTDLESMDNSYNAVVLLEFLDGSGKQVGQAVLSEQYRKNAWKPVTARVEAPDSATQARLAARINKETPGTLWVDQVAVSAVASDKKPEFIQRLTFTTAQDGNLLFPGDPRTVTLSLLAKRPLPAEDTTVSCVVRDYWGAEQGPPISVKLERKGKQRDLFAYEGTLDLSGQPLEEGRYYELHGEIVRKDADPFRNHTSLAILPEAAAHKYKPDQIPFTARNWDNRIPQFITLTKRLGIPTVGGFVTWDAGPPIKAKLAQEKLIAEQGLQLLTTTMAMQVERRVPGWEKWTEPALREAIRTFLTTYKDTLPIIVNLGNEPHNKGEDVKVDVETYRILYDEIKKVDPNITVVGTSVGTTNEDYFRFGFGQWCDAYDFHVYEPAEKVRQILEVRYPEMFKKYGHAKPIWSTELGLNSQGMKRQTVAGELIKKFVNFFAGGGVNVSWFGFLFPDPDGSKENSAAQAHNVFDSRYNKYAPKLDAIAYYNAVNGIAARKYVADKVYGDNLHAFLFRDTEDQAFQTLYKSKGREDVFVPLDGVQDVQVIRIDGRRTAMNAGGKGLTLTVDADPVILLYKGGPKTLPDKLGPPSIAMVEPPQSVIAGQPLGIEVALNGAAPETVSLHAPPFWEVSKGTPSADRSSLRFEVRAPQGSAVREADMQVVRRTAGAAPDASLVLRPRATGVVSVRALAVASQGDQPAGVRLVFTNNSPEPQDITWDMSLAGEQSLKAGAFSAVAPTDAHFAETAAGAIKLPAKGSEQVVVPLAGVDPLKLYRLAVSVRDASGRTLVIERPLGGFVAVPRAAAPPAIDGVLDEAAWQKAPAQRLDQADQFYVIFRKQVPPPSWDGASDLSATMQGLWDSDYLYLAVDVEDNATGKPQDGPTLWAQDGIQMLIDADRASPLKGGKNDYAMAVGINGPQAWCYQAGDPSVSPGNAADIKVGAKRKDEQSGRITYEIAIPWSRLVPFQPTPGANLGLTLAINEDDGPGRDSYMTWFGSVQTKDIETAGDLVLQE